MAYRPGRRAVIRSVTGSSPSYAKILEPSKARRLVRVLESLTEISDRRSDFPLVPRIETAIPEAGIIVTRHQAGTSLRTILDERRLSDQERDTLARGLSAFFAEDPGSGDELRRTDRDEESAWFSFVAAQEPDVAPSYERVLERLRPHVTDREDTSERYWTHGDLHEGNLLVQGDRLVLLDLDSIRLGDPYVDLGNLAAELLLGALRRGRPRSEGRADARSVVEAIEIRGTEEPPRDAHLRICTARAFFRLACVYRFRRRSRWLAPRMLEECLACIEA